MAAAAGNIYSAAVVFYLNIIDYPNIRIKIKSLIKNFRVAI